MGEEHYGYVTKVKHKYSDLTEIPEFVTSDASLLMIPNSTENKNRGFDDTVMAAMSEKFVGYGELKLGILSHYHSCIFTIISFYH